MQPDDPDDPSIAASPKPHWRLATRLLFRFGLLYFLLYSHPFPLDLIPDPARIAAALDLHWEFVDEIHLPWDKVYAYVGWIDQRQNDAVDRAARTWFGIERPLDRPLGSGDPTHSFIHLLLIVSLAFVGTVLWSLIDRRRKGHPRLAAWLHLGARFYLAAAMLGYGIAKVIPTQFSFPGLSRLITPWGDGTPMNILWSFIGSSTAYTIFAGAGEVVAGLLLLFRRTATLGALVACGVLTNVVALNFCYDVPVKLYSSHLLLVAMLLCLPDVRRLTAILLLNRPTAPRDLRFPRLPYVGNAVMLLTFVPLIALSIHGGLGHYRQSGKRPPRHGIWDVERYAIGDDEIQPLLTDPVRWQNLLIEGERFGSVRRMDGSLQSVGLAFDDSAKTLTLSSGSQWRYRLEADGSLVFEGEFLRFFRKHPMQPPTADDPRVPLEPQYAIRMRPRTTTVASAGAAPPLAGTWDVVSTDVIGELRSGRRSDPAEWRTLIVEQAGSARVEFGNGRVDTYGLQVDGDRCQATFSSSTSLTFEQADAEHLTLRGELRGHAIDIRLRRRDPRSFMLVRRGFHWINEIPLNRF